MSHRRKRPLCGLVLWLEIMAVALGMVLGWSGPALGDAFEDPLPTGATAKLRAKHVIRFSVAEVVPGPSGSVASLRVRMNTRGGFKIYDKGLLFEARPLIGAPWTLSYRSEPPPTEAHDPWYDEVRATHADGAVFSLSSDIALGAGDPIGIRIEACSVSQCLLPVWLQIEVQSGSVSQPVAAVAAADKQLAPGPGLPMWSPSPSPRAPQAEFREGVPAGTPKRSVLSFSDRVAIFVNEALGGRSFWLFPGLFLAGLLMNLTPCVYPMIPITLNVLGRLGRSSDSRGSAPGARPESDRGEGLIRAGFYVAGMVITYSAMGVAAGMTGTLFGSLLQSTAVVTALAVLFVVLGLGMLGVVDFSRVQIWASRIPISERSPHLGVLTMGAVSGLVSAPCTGPVLSAILVLIGQTQDPLYGVALMVFFSLGFGFPYLFLGIFAHNLRRLPRAGRLLELVKVVFAALLFGLALYYLRPHLGGVPPLDRLYIHPGLQGVALVIVLAALFRLLEQRETGRQDGQRKRNLARVGLILAMTQLALWLTLYVTNAFLAGAAAAPDQAGQPSETQQGNGVVSLRWHSDWQKAVAEARSEGKGLLVDAWAQWCAACLKMDAQLWADRDVIERLLKSYVPLKLDFTESSPFTDEIAKRWDLTGLPGVALFPVGSDFEALPQHLFRQEVKRDELFEAMDRLAAAKP